MCGRRMASGRLAAYVSTSEPATPTNVRGYALDHGSVAEIVAFCAWQYGMVPSWPTARVLCPQSRKIVELPCLWMRVQPKDFMITSDMECSMKCTCCGWLTGALLVGEEQCVACSNTLLCRGCASISPCLMCQTVDDAPPQFRCFLELLQVCLDRADHLQLSGRYHALNTCLRPLFAAWRQIGVEERSLRSRASTTAEA